MFWSCETRFRGQQVGCRVDVVPLGIADVDGPHQPARRQPPHGQMEPARVHYVGGVEETVQGGSGQNDES